MTSQIRVDEITNRSGLGTVTIYDNGFEFTGVTTFTEDVDITGSLTIGGVLTYEDTTNIDSVGVVTARAGVRIPDNQKIFLGTDSDLQIYHDGSNSYIKDDGTGSLHVQGRNLVLEDIDGENYLNAFLNGQVELFYDNSKKFETTSTGVKVTGDSVFGANSKAKLFENGTQSGVQATNSGSSAHLMTHDGNEDIHVDPSGYIKFEVAGSERLRVDSAGRMLLGTQTEGSAEADTFTIAESGSAGMTIRSGTAARGSIFFSDGTSGAEEYDGQIQYDQSERWMRFATAQTERLRIHSNGNVQVRTNNAQLFGAGTLLVNSGSSSGRLDLYGGSTNRGGEINLYGGSNSDGIIQFRSGAGANQQPERMRIDSSGCVRVGNTHSQTTSSNTKRIALGAKGSIWGWTSGNINGALTLADNYYWDGTNNRAIEADDAAYLSLRSGSLRFGTTDSTPSAGGVTGLYEKFRITSDGNVSVNHDSPNTRLYVRESGASISNGNAILNSTQKGIRLVNSNNDDTSLGLWFTTGDSHHAGISGQRNDYANTWGTDLRFYTHEDATNALTYARERLRINPHGLLINRKGQNAANTGGNILGRYKYTQHNQGSGYAHLILGPDGRKLQDYISTNCYAIITVCVTGTGTTNMYCQYYYMANSTPNSSSLTHMYGNSGSSSNRPYMNLQNTHDPAWLMSHNGGYRLDIEVAIYGGGNGFTYTEEFGDFAGNP